MSEYEPSRFRRAVVLIKHLSIAYAVGMAVGGYEVYRYEHAASDHLRDLVARGWCGQRDVEKTLFWYNCRDAYMATQLLQENEAADTALILSDMHKNQPVPPKQNAKRR